jgi:hypothetical protein
LRKQSKYDDVMAWLEAKNRGIKAKGIGVVKRGIK